MMKICMSCHSRVKNNLHTKNIKKKKLQLYDKRKQGDHGKDCSTFFVNPKKCSIKIFSQFVS